MDSIRKNSAVDHQILIHVNEGSDGTQEWVQAEGLEHTFSDENIGICKAMNRVSQKASTGYIVFMNDDMYALPGWDVELSNAIREAADQPFFISGTMIEPSETGNDCAIQGHSFGSGVSSFEEEKLLQSFADFPFADWNGATWPPNVVTKKMWEKVGGYSEEFSPGMYSDPDFAMKLWQEGVRYFRGVGASRVYHFQAKSTGKIEKNPGRAQFKKKWGISAADFSKYYLRRGGKFVGPLKDPEPSIGLKIARIKGKLS